MTFTVIRVPFWALVRVSFAADWCLIFFPFAYQAYENVVPAVQDPGSALRVLPTAGLPVTGQALHG